MKRIAKGGGNRGKIEYSEYFLFVDLDSITLSSEKHSLREIRIDINGRIVVEFDSTFFHLACR